MLGSLPRYSTLRSASAANASRDLPAVVLAVKTAPTADVERPASLLHRSVALSLLVHPTLERLLRTASRRRNADTYLLPAPAAPSADVLRIFAAAHPSLWTPRAGEDLDTVLGSHLLSACAAMGAALGSARPKRLAHTGLRIHRSGATLHVTATVAPKLWETLLSDLDAAEAHSGSRHHRRGQTRTGLPDPVALTPRDAALVLAKARTLGLVVLDADTPGRLSELDWVSQRSITITPIHDAPGWASVNPGAMVSAAVTGVMPAADTTALRAPRSPVAIATHPRVLGAATVAHASGVGRPGLHPWQDKFVTAYQNADRGLVNALAPGMGKTVCAAAAMAELAGTGERTSPYRALVVAPASLRQQWQRELANFFPAATLRVALTAADLVPAAAPTPDVLIASPELIARNSTTTETMDLDDLVIDEATYLARADSSRTRALWLLRHRATRAMVLTGTPDTRRLEDLGTLVAFALAQPQLFTQTPITAPHPAGVPAGARRVSPYLFTAEQHEEAALPQARLARTLLTPSAVEERIDQTARRRIQDLLELGRNSRRATATALHAELTAWRLGLASPAALLASKYALARAVSAGADGEAVATGTKLRWAQERIAAQVSAGVQVLVFSDFPPALEALAALLRTNGCATGLVTGSVPASRRNALVSDFTAGRVQTLLISATGQLGLNLQTAAHVLHLDVPASAGTLRQRTARAARLGSAQPTITVAVPVLRGCGDERLLKRLQLKTPVTDLWELAGHL